MRKLTNILFVLIALSVCSLSAKEMNKDEMFTRVKEGFESLNSIHLIFAMSDNSTRFGEIYAERGGKLHLALKDNIIISDGETIWNINPGNSVAISDYEASKELTLEHIFFELIDELEAISYTSLKSTESNNKFSLKLKPKERSEYQDKLKFLTIFFDSSHDMSRIDVDTKNGVMGYVIRLLEANPKIKSDKFTYTPSPDIEVIDFR